jgi:tripartite-type tricarboxylate transporter receptor subunit TctC
MERDFAPVIKASVSYNVLVVAPRVEARSMQDLVALAQKNPGKLNYSSGGFGTPAHLIGELFKLDRKLEAVHVPYQQFPQPIGDLLAGVNDYMFVTTLPVTSLVQAGKLRALAVTSPRQLDAFKNIPTVAELGFPQLAIEDWVAFMMPAKTPEAVVARMNEAMNKALQNDGVRKQLANIGAEPAGGSPASFAAFLSSEIRVWERTVKDANIKMPN